MTANFPQTCEQCHSTSTWLSATFNHTTTGFPLTGMHTVPPRQCTDCHVNNNYNLDEHGLRDLPPDGLPGHDESESRDVELPADLRAVPQHGNLAECDLQPQQHGLPADRLAHRAATAVHRLPRQQQLHHHQHGLRDLPPEGLQQGTTNPNHVTANFPQTCEQCHDTQPWPNAHVQSHHHRLPADRLAHRAAAALHRLPRQQQLQPDHSTACVTCHLKDYQGTTNPNHVTANFPQTCDQCHSTSTWLNATFNHNSTGFPLTGIAHGAAAACTDCHVNNNYNDHDDDLRLVPPDGLQQCDHARWPTRRRASRRRANSCHDTVHWTMARSITRRTGFPLTGAHTVPPRPAPIATSTTTTL